MRTEASMQGRDKIMAPHGSDEMTLCQQENRGY